MAPTKIRMIRRIDSGIMKIEDRKPMVDENGKKGFEKVFHTIGTKHSPKQAMEKIYANVNDPDNPGKKMKVEIPGEFMPSRDKKTGKPIWASYGESFDVFDWDFVKQRYSGILEPC